MPVTARETDEVQFFNELINLDSADLARAGQIEWRFRAMLKGGPRNYAAQIGLIQALVQQGKASEAMTEADDAWGSQAMLNGQVADTFQTQLMGLGRYERALHLLRRLSLDATVPAQELSLRRIQLMWQMGDFGGLRKAIAEALLLSGEASFSNWQQFQKEIDERGLAACLPEHQRIIRSKLTGHQVMISLAVLNSNDEDGRGPELSQLFYVAADYATRARIEDDLHDALESLYTAHGMCSPREQAGVSFWNLMTPMVMSVTSRPRYNTKQALTSTAH